MASRSVQMMVWKIWFVFAWNAHKSRGKQHSWTCKTVWIGNYTIVSLSRAITLQSSVCQAPFYCGKHTPLQFMQIFSEQLCDWDLVADLLYLWWYVMSHRLASFSVLSSNSVHWEYTHKHPVQEEIWLIAQTGSACVKWTGPRQRFGPVQYVVTWHVSSSREKTQKTASFRSQTQVTLVTPFLFVLFVFKKTDVYYFLMFINNIDYFWMVFLQEHK